MNTKLAFAALCFSVAMCCSVSEGQLLDRMLSKAGCSACNTAVTACDGGCDTGCSGGPGVLSKITDRLGKVGCGEGCFAAPEPCGCAAPVVEAPSCGCEAAPAPSCGGDAPVFMGRLKDRLSALGSGDCGCGAPAPAADCGCGSGPGLFANLQGRMSSLGGAADCGCGPAPAPVAAPCGCGPAPSIVRTGPGLLDNLKGRMSSLGGAADCGCGAPAPAPAPCAAPIADPCGAAPALGGGGGLLDRLKGRMSSLGGGGGCGCSAAPIGLGSSCGAPAPTPCMTPAPAPVSCGCDAAPAPVVSGCGCDAPAPAVSSCGCDSGSAFGGERPKLTLLDRLRGNRIPRDREGRLIGGGCNDGCNPPCPGMAPEMAPASDCGCGAPMISQPVSDCTSCGGGAIMAAPYAGAAGAIYSDGSGSGSRNEGVIVETPEVTEPAASEGGVIEEALEDALEGGDETPTVDPNAFIIRKGETRG